MRPEVIGEISGALPTEGTIRLPSEPLTSTPTDGVSFEGILGHAIERASATQHVADNKAERLAAGVFDDIHGTMIAAKEAEISMKLVGSIRNKLLDAFHELWRTGV